MMSNHVLTRDDIMAVRDLAPMRIEVPEWGGSVWIKQLTAAERIDLEDLMDAGQRSGLDVITLFLCRVLVDDENQRLLTDDDAAVLGEKNPDVLMRLNDAAQKHNGMGVKEIEALEKN